MWYNYDFFSQEYRPEGSICGLHGGSEVTPGGPQQNLDNRGGCGFAPFPVQELTLF